MVNAKAGASTPLLVVSIPLDPIFAQDYVLSSGLTIACASLANPWTGASWNVSASQCAVQSVNQAVVVCACSTLTPYLAIVAVAAGVSVPNPVASLLPGETGIPSPVPGSSQANSIATASVPAVASSPGSWPEISAVGRLVYVCNKLLTYAPCPI